MQGFDLDRTAITKIELGRRPVTDMEIVGIRRFAWRNNKHTYLLSGLLKHSCGRGLVS